MMQHWHMALLQRRTLLGLGVAGSALVALSAGGIAWLYEPAWRDRQLLPAGRRVLAAVARAVLDGQLPDEPRPQADAIAHHLERMTALLRNLPPHTQREVAELLALLALPPTRLALASLATPWEEASVAEVQASLRAMRGSSLLLRRQAFAALRDLTRGAFFADPSTWALMRYPGPRVLP
jgi:hypothetical protein